MNSLPAAFQNTPLPALFRVKQSFPGPQVSDIQAAVKAQIAKPEITAELRYVKKAAIAVGSRGIANLQTIVKTLVEELKSRHIQTMIVPAMGSHGGATAEGQRAILAGYGITEEQIGAPVECSMDVVNLGTIVRQKDESTAQASLKAGRRELDALAASAGIPIYVDRIALTNNTIIPVARIKPHTGFRGPYESGICKMLAIGLSKHIGASRIHREGYESFAEIIPAAAQAVLAEGKVGFALGIVENSSEQTALIEAVANDQVLKREPELLELAKKLMPRILLSRIDVLIVEEMGKEISGVGMDSNVVGRTALGPTPDFDGPQIARIVALRMSPHSTGNAVGIGTADLVTQQLVDAIDFQATYANILTSGALANAKIPVTLPSENDVIRAAINCVPGVSPEKATVVRIKNTLHLSEIAVSENLLPEIAKVPQCSLAGPFDGTWK